MNLKNNPFIKASKACSRIHYTKKDYNRGYQYPFRILLRDKAPVGYTDNYILIVHDDLSYEETQALPSLYTLYDLYMDEIIFTCPSYPLTRTKNWPNFFNIHQQGKVNISKNFYKLLEAFPIRKHGDKNAVVGTFYNDMLLIQDIHSDKKEKTTLTVEDPSYYAATEITQPISLDFRYLHILKPTQIRLGASYSILYNTILGEKVVAALGNYITIITKTGEAKQYEEGVTK